MERIFRQSPTAVIVVALLLAGSSCEGRKPVAEGEGEGEEGEGEGEEGEGEGFDDHTVSALRDQAAFDAVAKAGPSSAAAKFIITRFGDALSQSGSARLRFYDANFYALHDEIYWFRLLNGQPIDGLTAPEDRPVTTSHGPFSSIDEVRQWAGAERLAGRTLPLDLTFVGDERLYSPRFYELALYELPRTLGIGTLLHFPAVAPVDDNEGRGEIWALELEFSDEPTADDLRAFFEQIEGAVGGGVGANLKWITRSLAQAEIAAALPADLRDRTISYADVVVPGQKEVYAEGLTAGRLLIVRRGEEALLLTSRSTDVLVVEDVPDFLPACAALLTAAPQTALAHVNLLARNRGIPNAFVAGVDQDPNLDQLARVRAPVIVSADLDGDASSVVIRPMSDADFATWRSLTTPATLVIAPPDLTGVGDVYDLSSLPFEESERWRSVLGGKNTGFLALIAAGVEIVDRPQGISIKPYLEHLSTTTDLGARIAAMLGDRSFQGDATVRQLVLAGPTPADAIGVDPEFVEAFKAGRPPGNVLRDLVDDGGVQGVILTTPIAPSTLASITTALGAAFGHYDRNQDLRFRSSSNLEDAEGFNSAGLYTSHTGSLDPDADELGVEDAVRRVWASYWSREAFEERRLGAIDHLSGAMGVVVHANFPHRLQRSNGVAVMTIPPRAGDPIVFEVNQQIGALSVTNPPPGSPHLPEIDRVTDDGDGVLRIERLRGSTVLLPGAQVLDDATLVQMFNDSLATTRAWLAGDNARLPAAQRRSTLTLNLESRVLEAGWPELRSGARRPARLVWKQARPLEPTATRPPPAIQALPVPKDILARARRVVRHTCDGEALTLFATEVITDPTLPPDMGYAVEPFTSFVVVDFKVAAPSINVAARQRRSAVHTVYAAVDHPVIDWSLDVTLVEERQAALQLQRVRVAADGVVTVDNGGSFSAPTTCVSENVFAAPADFLAGLLAP